MRRVLLVASLLLALAPSSFAVSPLVQPAQNQCASSTAACTATFPGSVTAGNLVVAFCRYNGTGRTTAITDTAGNTYTQRIIQITGGAANREMVIDSAYNVTGGWTVISCDPNGAAVVIDIIAYELSGALTASDPFDKSASTGNNGTALDSGATATTSQAAEVLVACGTSSGTRTFTAGASYVNLVQQPTGTNLGNSACETLIVAATGTYNGTMSISGAASDWAAGIVTFKNTVAVTRRNLSLLGVGK